MTVIVRGYKSGVLLWKDHLVVGAAEVEQIIPRLAAQHVEAIQAGALGMIELEFPEEPDPNDRYFRIGVEPEGMVMPIAVSLGKDGPPQ